MRTAIFWIVTGMLTPGIVAGQPRTNGQATVLTVCEVLGDVARYANTAVAVAGRMERSVSLIDHYEFLSQDRCERPVITHGHAWSDRIQVWTGRQAGMPKPPGNRPKLEPSVLASKLSVLRQTTPLGSHKEPQFKSDGHAIVFSQIADVPNAWAVVYGRIVRVPDLNKNCGAEGCGGDDVPLVIVAEPYNIHELRDDGTLFPQVK
jgi:hypothetical protein